MAGAVVSTTVTIWVQVTEFPWLSARFQVRVALKVLPHVLLVTVPVVVMATVAPSQASVAVGLLNVQAVPHSTVLLVEQTATGGRVSTTVTLNEQLAVLPLPSFAVEGGRVLPAREKRRREG